MIRKHIPKWRSWENSEGMVVCTFPQLSVLPVAVHNTKEDDKLME